MGDEWKTRHTYPSAFGAGGARIAFFFKSDLLNFEETFRKRFGEMGYDNGFRVTSPPTSHQAEYVREGDDAEVLRDTYSAQNQLGSPA